MVSRYFRTFLGMVLLVGVLLSAAPAAARETAQGTAYQVQPGDTLFSLSRRFGVTVHELAAANALSDGAWLYAGQPLVIPHAEGIWGGLYPNPPTPTQGDVYTVQPGDTLLGLAVRYGIRVSALAEVNNLYWNSWLYAGQRLIIPGLESQQPPATATPAPAASGGTYGVKAGDNLFRIALNHGTTVAALQAANGLATSIVYVGQTLIIPDGSQPAPSQPLPPPGQGLNGEKWIDVNLSAQTLTAYEGQTPVFTALVSTGLWGTPTVVGTFEIYVKYVSTVMSGPGYYLPNVPYTMYFYRGYGIHGTYWHNNFGHPMSHGCVNMRTDEAEWLFNWAPVGTKVVTHY